LGQGSIQAAYENLRDARDGGERRAKFMAHVGQEPALELRRLAQLHGVFIELGIQGHDPLVGFRQLRFEHGELGLLFCDQRAQRLNLAAHDGIPTTRTVTSSRGLAWSRYSTPAITAGCRTNSPG